MPTAVWAAVPPTPFATLAQSDAAEVPLPERPSKNQPAKPESDRVPANWTEAALTTVWSSRWRRVYIGSGIIFGGLWTIWASLPDRAKERAFVALGWESGSEKRVADDARQGAAPMPQIQSADVRRYWKAAVTTLSRFLIATQAAGDLAVLTDPQSPLIRGRQLNVSLHSYWQGNVSDQWTRTTDTWRTLGKEGGGRELLGEERLRK